EPVADHPEQHRADEQADETRAEHGAERLSFDLPVRDDRGCDVAHRLHVEAVHDQKQPAENEHADLVAVQAASVDDGADVDLVLRHDPPVRERRPIAAPMRAILAEARLSRAPARAGATRSLARTRARARKRAPRRDAGLLSATRSANPRA